MKHKILWTFFVDSGFVKNMWWTWKKARVYHRIHVLWNFETISAKKQEKQAENPSSIMEKMVHSNSLSSQLSSCYLWSTYSSWKSHLWHHFHSTQWPCQNWIRRTRHHTPKCQNLQVVRLLTCHKRKTLEVLLFFLF